jgi:hypothetical protein
MPEFPGGRNPDSFTHCGPEDRKRLPMPAERRIVGYHQDQEQHWVAELECGHTQHVRHTPPWQVREWVITPEGRASHMGTLLACRLCEERG